MTGEMRAEVVALAALGPLPTDSESLTDAPLLQRWEELVVHVTTPLSDSEANLLAASFPPDDSDAFGAAWTLVHLLESAPDWPPAGAFDRTPRYWREILLTRLHKFDSP